MGGSVDNTADGGQLFTYNSNIQYTLAVLSVQTHTVRNLFCTVYMRVHLNV